MNKKMGILIIIGLLILIGIGIYIYVKNTTSNSDEGANYEANRTSTETNTSEGENNSDNENATNTQENTSSEENQTNTSDSNTTPAPQIVEEQVSTFSTRIYSNDSNRNKNMEITISTLNGTIVKNGETFSFCNTVGPATSSKGYLEADIYDHNGKKKKGYGGGNCQVSSTLYNAVLAVPSLTVVERHPHSNHVPYVAEGKDAAVAYGSYDFKFKNETGNDIKIQGAIANGTVTMTLITLKAQ